MKVVVAAFNQEKALVGAFSVIVKTDCETDGSFGALTKDVLLSRLLMTAPPRHNHNPDDDK